LAVVVVQKVVQNRARRSRIGDIGEALRPVVLVVMAHPDEDVS
jgi:hypothetical protein